MRSCVLICLVAAASASPSIGRMEDVAMPVYSESDRVNDLLDVVESGLSAQPEGRLLFADLTATVTSYTTTETVTVTTTERPQCYKPENPTEILDCAVVEAAAAAAAAAAEAAASGDGRMRSMKQQINPFPIGATVSRSDGMNADISDLIHPTPALQENTGRFDYDAFDGVIRDDEPLQKGSLSWREMKVEGMSSCGRSAGRRPRLLNLSTMTVEAIKTMTSTSTVINPTVTMTVMGVGCTTAGFSFGVPECPAVVVPPPTGGRR